MARKQPTPKERALDLVRREIERAERVEKRCRELAAGCSRVAREDYEADVAMWAEYGRMMRKTLAREEASC